MSSSPYFAAAQLLQQIWTTKKSLKTLAYDKKGQLRCNKATYAQVCHVLESKRVLDRVFQVSGKACHEMKKNARNPGLLYVLLYELLLGPNKKIRGGGALKRQIMSQETVLQSALEQVQETLSDTGDNAMPLFPRYVRVNTLKCSTDEVAESFSETFDKNGKFFVDHHVPNVLVLPPTTGLGGHEFVKSGKVVLQDKSSCFSALCLMHGNSSPIVDGDYLDACAAPGNKTSHLAALLASAMEVENDNIESSSSTNKKKRKAGKTKRVIYALDRSSDRLKLLQRRMDQMIPSDHSQVQVMPHHKDFLQTDPSDAEYKSLKGILLDPSCSGSGIFTSPDRSTDKGNKTDKSRIESLSNFQLVALKHAMSFQQVDRIVYSTCSLHEQENENVVAQAIEANSEWEVVAPQCLNGWKRRGHAVKGLSKEQAECLIRADKGDDTNGFFVSYFERKGSSDHKTTKSSSAADLLHVPKGLTLYNGQFSTASAVRSGDSSKQKKQQTKGAEGGKCPDKDDSSSPKKDDTDTQKAPVKEGNVKAISKKRAKKLAWKKRQMKQKIDRMQKKATDQDAES